MVQFFENLQYHQNYYQQQQQYQQNQQQQQQLNTTPFIFKYNDKQQYNNYNNYNYNLGNTQQQQQQQQFVYSNDIKMNYNHHNHNNDAMNISDNNSNSNKIQQQQQHNLFNQQLEQEHNSLLVKKRKNDTPLTTPTSTSTPTTTTTIIDSSSSSSSNNPFDHIVIGQSQQQSFPSSHLLYQQPIQSIITLSTTTSPTFNNNNNNLYSSPLLKSIIDKPTNLTVSTPTKRLQYQSKDGQVTKYSTTDITPTVQEKTYGERLKESLVSTSGWRDVLQGEFEQPYFKRLIEFLEKEDDTGMLMCPKLDQVFRAFNITPFQQVKVVIVGSDPYHGTDQANGLAFSFGQPDLTLQEMASLPSTKHLPAQLINIYKELQSDLGVCAQTKHGILDKWAKQGVLLLNSVLTVKKGAPESHTDKGWETFTDRAIQLLSQHRQGIVFMLWGKQAQSKQSLIKEDNHHSILTSSHPFSFTSSSTTNNNNSSGSNSSFFGCKHFSKANSIIQQQQQQQQNQQNQKNQQPIDWNLDQSDIMIDQNHQNMISSHHLHHHHHYHHSNNNNHTDKDSKNCNDDNKENKDNNKE